MDNLRQGLPFLSRVRGGMCVSERVPNVVFEYEVDAFTGRLIRPCDRQSCARCGRGTAAHEQLISDFSPDRYEKNRKQSREELSVFPDRSHGKAMQLPE